MGGEDILRMEAEEALPMCVEVFKICQQFKYGFKEFKNDIAKEAEKVSLFLFKFKI